MVHIHIIQWIFAISIIGVAFTVAAPLVKDILKVSKKAKEEGREHLLSKEWLTFSFVTSGILSIPISGIMYLITWKTDPSYMAVLIQSFLSVYGILFFTSKPSFMKNNVEQGFELAREGKVLGIDRVNTLEDYHRYQGNQLCYGKISIDEILGTNRRIAERLLKEETDAKQK